MTTQRCDKCKGAGVVWYVKFPIGCDKCHGTGRIPSNGGGK